MKFGRLLRLPRLAVLGEPYIVLVLILALGWLQFPLALGLLQFHWIPYALLAVAALLCLVNVPFLAAVWLRRRQRVSSEAAHHRPSHRGERPRAGRREGDELAEQARDVMREWRRWAMRRVWVTGAAGVLLPAALGVALAVSADSGAQPRLANAAFVLPTLLVLCLLWIPRRLPPAIRRTTDDLTTSPGPRSLAALLTLILPGQQPFARRALAALREIPEFARDADHGRLDEDARRQARDLLWMAPHWWSPQRLDPVVLRAVLALVPSQLSGDEIATAVSKIALSAHDPLVADAAREALDALRASTGVFTDRLVRAAEAPSDGLELVRPAATEPSSDARLLVTPQVVADDRQKPLQVRIR